MYITFEEYLALGGVITDESTFTVLERKARRHLDYITMNALQTYTDIPDEVQELMVAYIELVNSNEEMSNSGIENVSNYSNGSETVTYVHVTEQEYKKKFVDLAREYLANTGLLYRGGVRFDYV